MVTMLRSGGLRIVIYVNDHLPAHVHVFGASNGGIRSMTELTDTEIDAALERGRSARNTESRATHARYDRATGRVMIELSNGCAFAFPAALTQGLQHATADQLETVEILGAGSGLHWEPLDADLSVPDLLAGFFGTRAHMARQAGQTKSAAKSQAARANGAKGGRPRRVTAP